MQLSRAALPPVQQAALAAGTSNATPAADGAGASSSRPGATPGTSSKRHRAAASKAPAAAPPAGPESVWSPGKPALVTHQHVAAANQEMANALHMQLLKGCSTWQLLLLVGVVVEARATGQVVVCLEVRPLPWLIGGGRCGSVGDPASGCALKGAADGNALRLGDFPVHQRCSQWSACTRSCSVICTCWGLHKCCSL